MPTLSASARQPFACLDGSRLQQLTSIKNKQNAVPTNLASPSKRRRDCPEQFDDIDTENIDPILFSVKRLKNLKGNPVKSAETQTPPVVPKRSTVASKRLSVVRTEKKTAPKAPACAPAGRSPRSNRVGSLPRRRISARTDLPFSRLPQSHGGLPFSIDTALSGTVSSYTPKPVRPVPVSTLSEPVHKPSWMFKIHEDSLDEELGNMVEFSTQILDISDDESKRAERDDRGKENIPPTPLEATVAATRPALRRDTTARRSRTPLGGLVVSEFYAEGCDVNSCIIVPAEKPSSEKPSSKKPCNHASSPRESATDNQDAWKSILACIEEQKAAAATGDHLDQTAPSISVWERESVEAEDEL